MNDARVAQLIQDGSEDGYRLLLEEIIPRVKGGLIRRFGRSYEMIVEDALADAIKTAWLKIDQYDAERGSFVTWLFTIARNAVVSELRAERLRPLLEAVGEVDLSRVTDPAANAQPRSAQRTRMLDQLNACIGKLSPLQRDIIVSDLRNGQSTDGNELATKWETTPNVIRVSRHKAHHRLKDLMRRMQ